MQLGIAGRTGNAPERRRPASRRVSPFDAFCLAKQCMGLLNGVNAIVHAPTPAAQSFHSAFYLGPVGSAYGNEEVCLAFSTVRQI